MLKEKKELKLYYSISEVAEEIGVSETLLRFWEKEFTELKPKRAGRGIRQYTKEDIAQLRLIYHLMKERGMTLTGARKRLKDNREGTERNFELVDRLQAIRKQLVGMRDALDAFTYNQVEELKERITSPLPPESPA